jgi:hypothetical protein
MRIEPFRKILQGVANISEFSVEIFILNLSTMLGHEPSEEIKDNFFKQVRSTKFRRHGNQGWKI